MLIKQKSPSFLRNLALGTFGELLIVFSTKVNLLCPSIQRPGGVVFCICTFLRTLILMTQVISLPVFPSRTSLKLHNISVTPKMVKKVIMNLDLSKASGPDGIPVVVLKNCEPESSYILAELFNKFLKESCFPDCWKVSLVFPVYKMLRKGLQLNIPPCLLSVVSKVFEKLVNNRIADHLDKCGLLSDFQYGFRSSESTADLPAVIFDRIARAFNRPRAT